ncbi:MAG: thioredoxin domain-containing protein, partial [Winogradskyella sp.]|nr:thioredoxin domain-containing protein [Winogradskyella sp.]
CHWCHVMEEESFANDSVAKIMNDDFISIKVDREERPDVDQVYMNAVQLMTGSGGWPLNCITLPDGRPVFGGTYFTKEQWTKILLDMSNLYRNEPEKVIAYAEKLTEGIKNTDLVKVSAKKAQFKESTIAELVLKLEDNFDHRYGGQKGEPKFPMPSHLDFLLRYSDQNEAKNIKAYVFNSLDKIANGGIYDHIGGGFSRYAVDKRWHVPHFEKMLYDNAQLVSLYSKAYQITGDQKYRAVVEETLEFIERELTAPEGGFYSSIDADSENSNGEIEEGSFYIWHKAELKTLIKQDYDLFQSYYNINALGNWEEDKYILYVTESDLDFSRKHNINLEDLRSKIESWKLKLFNYRTKRIRPRTDDKTLTSWNALMISGYISAYRSLGNDTYLEKAIRNANFLLENQVTSVGGLYHSHKDGKSTIQGFSEDYAHTIAAFIDLYQVTLDDRWVNEANKLMTYCIKHFQDEDNKMFYFTSDQENQLISRKYEVMDNVITASNSVLANSLFQLGHYYFNNEFRETAKQMLSNVEEDAIKAPSAYTNWLNLYMSFSNPYYEVVISGPKSLTKLKEINSEYLPNITIAGAESKSELPILKNKFNEDETYIYVCVEGSCKLPVMDVSDALKQINK